MKRTLLACLLCGLLIGMVWQAQSQSEATEEDVLAAEQALLNGINNRFLGSWDSNRFGAYLNYNIPGSTFLIDIMAQRAEGTQRAQARVSYKFSRSSALRLARVDFLSPQEVAGDVFIIRSNEDETRSSEVFFWNPDLVSALKIDSGFEVFGDANVFEVIGSKIGDGQYVITKRSFSSLEPSLPAPETHLFVRSGGAGRRVKTTARLAEFDLEPISVRRETVPFAKIKVLAFLNEANSIYQVQLMDASGDLLHTISYDWQTNRRFPSTSGQVGGFYAETQVVENHVIPGNITNLIIRDIEIEAFPEEMFDPNQLGR